MSQESWQEESFSFTNEDNHQQHEINLIENGEKEEVEMYEGQEEEEQENEEEIMRKMMEMQLEYERLRKKYEQINVNKKKKVNGKVNTMDNNTIVINQDINTKQKNTNIYDNSNNKTNINNNNNNKYKYKLNETNINNSNFIYPTHQKERTQQHPTSSYKEEEESFVYSNSNENQNQNQNKYLNVNDNGIVKEGEINYETNRDNNKRNRINNDNERTFVYCENRSFETQQCVKEHIDDDSVQESYSQSEESFLFSESCGGANKKEEKIGNKNNNNNNNTFRYEPSEENSESRLDSFEFNTSNSYFVQNRDDQSINYKTFNKNNNNNKESILSKSNDENESFEFKNDDSLPESSFEYQNTQLRNHNEKLNQKGNKMRVYENQQRGYNKHESFNYQSSTTGEESFEYEPSEQSILKAKRYEQQQQLTNSNNNNTNTREEQHEHSLSRSFSFEESAILPINQSNGNRNNKNNHNHNQNKNNHHAESITQEKGQKEQQELSSDASFEPNENSINNNNNKEEENNFEYDLKKFSFELPENIHDPFEIKEEQSIDLLIPADSNNQNKPYPKKAYNNNKFTKKPQPSPTKPFNLSQINEAYNDEYESEEEEQLFIKKLINKLNTRKHIPVKEIKSLLKEIKLLAEENMELVEIFETGTYELDYIDKGGPVEWNQKYIQKINNWKSKVFITQLSFSSNSNCEFQDDFFMNISLPNIQEITIKIVDEKYREEENGKTVKKRPDEKYSIGFLKYNGLCKKLRTLSLRGETMTLEIARNIVDLDFPTLKSFYLGFEAYLTDEVVDMLTCNRFNNMPKAVVYVARWDDEIDTRFRYCYDKVRFIPLEEGEESLSIEEIKYRAKKINNYGQEKEREGLLLSLGLGKYFENDGEEEKNVSEEV